MRTPIVIKRKEVNNNLYRKWNVLSVVRTWNLE